MNKAQRQAKTHNDQMRKVNYRSTYSFNAFLSQSNGNLLINGGTTERRRECLVEYICDTRAKSNKTIVVFSDDTVLESNLISLAGEGKIGQLFVCSENYPSYDFFRGMRHNLICEYFNRIALETGAKDTTELNSYAPSFLSILSSEFPVNLNSMFLYSRND